MAVDERLAREIAALQAALASQPEPKRFGDLAQLLARAGRLPEALRAAERGVGLRPDLAEVHRAYGQVLVLAGRLEEAIRSFERACALASSDPELFLSISQSLVESGQLPAAMPYLDRAARLAPSDPRVNSLRAMLEASRNQLGAGQPPVATDEFLADGEELLSPLEAEASPAPAAPDDPDDLDDEVEPPTMYLANPLMQQPARPEEQPGALRPSQPAGSPPDATLDSEDREEQETRMDSEAGLRAEVSNAVNKVVHRPRSDEPPTRLAEPLPAELDPWDREPSVRQAPGGGVAPPDTMAMRAPPAPLPAPASSSPRAAQATPSSSISYWKVFLVVVPLLLLAIVAGVWVGYRHIRDEQITDLLDQASGAISQDTMAGYTDARDRLQKLREIQPEHVRGRAMLALVSARLQDEYGPNLSLREEAESLLGPATDETALEQLAARLHLAQRPPPAELLNAIQAAQKRAAADPRLAALAAEGLVRAGQPAEARPFLDAALAVFPSDVRLLDLRAEVAERAGELPAALELAGRAQAIHGVHVHSLLRLSSLRLRLGKDLPRAEEDLGRLLQLPLVTDLHRAQAHRMLAELAFLTGERTRALSAVQAATTLRPDDADFQLELAQVCLRYNALDEAATHAARVLELRPEAIEARLLGLAALLPRSKAREALKGLDGLVGQKVPAAPFLVLRGEALLLTGNAAGAAADLRQVPERAEERPRALALLGLAQLEGGDAEGSRRTLQALLKEHPDQPLAQYAMGRYREDRNLRQGAQAAYQKAIELEPRCFQAFTALGWMEFDDRHFPQAEAWVQKALQANPYAVEAQFLFGQLKLRGSEPQQALEAFARVLTERPEHAEALVGMAEALLDLGDLEKARVAAAKARKMGWKDAHSLHVEGQVELASGRFYPAMRALLAATAEDRSNPEILADLGLAQLGARSITAAEKSLKDSLRRKKLLRAQEGLARLLQTKGQWSQAAGAYEAAAALAKRQAKPAAEVHRLYMLAARAMTRDNASGDGRWGKARRLFRLASQSLPEDAEALFEVAATFDRQDNLGGARAAYLKVLEGHPDHAPTLFRLGLLEYDDRKEAKAKELLTKFLGLQDKGPDAKRAREVLKRIK